MARTAPVKKPRALVAAAKRIVGEQAGRMVPKVSDSTKELWEFYDLIPEVKESVWYLGNQIAKAELFVGVDVDGTKVDVIDPDAKVDPRLQAAAVEELGRLSLSSGGVPELMRIGNMNWEVAGEYYLVGFAERVINVAGGDGLAEKQVPLQEEWMAVAADLIHREDDKRVFLLAAPGDTSPQTRREILVNDEVKPDWLERMFLRHPRNRNKSDSLLGALRLDMAWLVALKYQGIAEANSRRNAGLLLVPDSLDAGKPKAVNSADDHPDEDELDPILVAIDESVTAPLDDPMAASSVMPVYLKGPAEQLQHLRYLEFGRTTDASVDQLIKSRVDTIARGANLPVERVMGLQQTTFANQAGVDVDELEDYHRPRLEQHVDALTSGFLRPRLLAREEKFDPVQVERLLVWYDPSGLMRDPDPMESADYGFEHGLVSAEAWRRAKGWDETDAPKPEEILVMAALRSTMPSTVILAALKAMGAEFLADVELPAPPVPGGPVAPGAAEDEAALQEARLVAAVEGVFRRSLAAAAVPRWPRSIPAGRSGLN